MVAEKISSLRIGGTVLGLGICLGLGQLTVLWRFPELGPSVQRSLNIQRLKSDSFQFSLGLKENVPAVCFPKIEEELAFSFSLPRPGGIKGEAPLLIRAKKRDQALQVALPARIDLRYDEGLVFVPEASSFWMELQKKEDKVEGKVFAQFEQDTVSIQTISMIPEKTPIQREFPESSPFRILAGAKWLGPDLFLKKCKDLHHQRFEIGQEGLEISEDQWFVWKGEKWEKSLEPLNEFPIAHIEQIDRGQLILEGWEGDTHVRISMQPISPIPFKVRSEDLFSAIRIRSEKQISCTLEKQCLILSVGDWVLKNENHWKVLKQKEEKEAFQRGDLLGELFVLERIEPKQGIVQGTLFDTTRSQVVSLELPAFSSRSAKKGTSR